MAESKVNKAGEAQLPDVDLEYRGAARNLRGPLALGVGAIAVAMSLFHLYTAAFQTLPAVMQMGIHLAFALLLAFLLIPATLRSRRRDRVPIYDAFLALAGAGVVVYLLYFYPDIVLRAGAPTTVDVAVGALAIFLVLEATRRKVGLALPIIALIFIGYAFAGPYLPAIIAHRGYSLRRVVDHLFYTSEGIFGVPLWVSATFVFMFVMFGSFLERSGAGDWFLRVAFSLVGGARGGPAKVAVLGSGFLGTIVGSSVANVVTTGSFTIPIMKKLGFKPETAGAVEVAASTNAQFLPPIMGAAAFVMAEMTGIPYLEIAKAAFIPAVLSYVAILGIVHLESLKLNLVGLPRKELPPILPTLLSGLHYIIPVGVLLYLLMGLKMTPLKTAYYSTLSVIAIMVVQRAVQAVRSAGQQGLRKAASREGAAFVNDVVAALQSTAKNMIGIALACATAGIIVGVITLTGLGLRMTSLILHLAGGRLWLTLLFTGITSLILGTAMPTTAKYIVVSVLAVPAILRVGGPAIPLIAAHLFIFYYAILADDTPPVGLAAYAAAGIAHSDPFKTGIRGFKFDLAAFLLPFMFVYNPGLLLIDVTWYQVLLLCVTSVVGMYAFSAAIQGYFLVPARWWERILLAAIGVAMVQPNLVTDLIGLGLLSLVYFVQRARRARLKSSPAAAG